jgi:hypothetical protein
MLNNYLADLKNTIYWAQCQDDMDVFNLARKRMEKAVRFVASIDCAQTRQAAYSEIDELLPTEWPMWMEACRYQDLPASVGVTLH